jgi:hypothetical protein
MAHICVCPVCKSSYINRSRRKGFIEKVFCAMTGALPYRCRDCKTRFFTDASPPQENLIGESKVA